MVHRTKRRSLCQICDETESKYTCTVCAIMYCSLACYKTHKEKSCDASRVDPNGPQAASSSNMIVDDEPSAPDPIPPVHESDISLGEDPKPLRPLTSLKWPYVPEQSAYPDPLERDDPKPLQTHQYEAIATSVPIRKVLATNPQLASLLTKIDGLRGLERERALQHALGVTAPDITGKRGAELDEDTLALRALAEAVETAVRGGKEGSLGLDWGE